MLEVADLSAFFKSRGYGPSVPEHSGLPSLNSEAMVAVSVRSLVSAFRSMTDQKDVS